MSPCQHPLVHHTCFADSFSENLTKEQNAAAQKRRGEREKKQEQQKEKQMMYETDTDEDELVSDTDSDCELPAASEAPEVVPRAVPTDQSAAEVLFALHRQSADLPVIQSDKLAEDLSVMYAEHIFQRHKKQPITLFDALLTHSRGESDYLPPVSEVEQEEEVNRVYGKMYLLPGDERMCEWAGQVRSCYIQSSEGGLAQTAPSVLGAFRSIIRGESRKKPGKNLEKADSKHERSVTCRLGGTSRGGLHPGRFGPEQR